MNLFSKTHAWNSFDTKHGLSTDDNRWRYLAPLNAGSNHDANCDPDSAGAMPCIDTDLSLPSQNARIAIQLAPGGMPFLLKSFSRSLSFSVE